MSERVYEIVTERICELLENGTVPWHQPWNPELGMPRSASTGKLYRENGVPLYHMIFATDNDAGTRIMERIYHNTAVRMPEMAREARDRATGQQALDLGLEATSASAGYLYEPPWEPRS